MKNSNTVVEWFKGIDHKKDCIFTKCDIQEFYPFILENILNLNFICKRVTRYT